MSELIQTWQQLPQNINPVFLQLGSLQLRYYGVLFVLAILVSYMLSLQRQKSENTTYQKSQIENYYTWVLLGVVIGGRLGYVLFYNLGYYLQHPLEIILPFQLNQGVEFTGISGMSYHGGLVGVILATYLYCRNQKLQFLSFADFIIPSVPAGYFFGRVGNFMNGELYGRVTEFPMGMQFIEAEGVLRHPSQLYEALGEGIVLFLILWSLKNRNLSSGSLLFIYILGYGMIRFFIEYTREPDAHIGLIGDALSMGQILCLLMAFVGLAGCVVCNKINPKGGDAPSSP